MQITDGYLTVKFNTLGAEMQSLCTNDNQEFLWQAEPSIWPRHAPVLFPMVGRLKNDQLIHQNKPFSLTQHGFARDSEFAVLDHNHVSIAFVLSSNAASKVRYPFDFELVIRYTLHEHILFIDYTVRNPSTISLPVSIGAHPAFKWPLAENKTKNQHFIQFEKPEQTPVRRLSAGLLLPDSQASPVSLDTLMLSDELFENDALIFDQLQSHSLTYGIIDQDYPRLRIRYADFPHLGLWSKSRANFLCIEPWQGYASPLAYDGEFSAKPGIVQIPSHAERSWRHSIEIKIAD